MKTKNERRNDKMRNVAYYLSLPYPVEIVPVPQEEGGGYAACIPMLGRWSAVGDGDTPEAAYADLRASLPSLLGDWIARGVPIPEPDVEMSSPSGRLSLRLPKSLHRQTAQIAQEEGVSINQWITAALAQAIGSRRDNEEQGASEART